MVSEGECRALAESNRALAERLATAGEYNWAIVLVFYSALYLVNALMVRAGEFSDDARHGTRSQFVDDYHPAIAADYEHLFQKSIMGRYLIRYRADLDTYERQLKHLLRIRRYVERVLDA